MSVQIDSSTDYPFMRAHLGYDTTHRIEPAPSKKAAFRLEVIEGGLPGAVADFADDGALVAKSLLPEHMVDGLRAAAAAWIDACAAADFPFTLDGGLR